MKAKQTFPQIPVKGLERNDTSEYYNKWKGSSEVSDQFKYLMLKTILEIVKFVKYMDFNDLQPGETIEKKAKFKNPYNDKITTIKYEYIKRLSSKKKRVYELRLSAKQWEGNWEFRSYFIILKDLPKPKIIAGKERPINPSEINTIQVYSKAHEKDYETKVSIIKTRMEIEDYIRLMEQACEYYETNEIIISAI